MKIHRILLLITAAALLFAGLVLPISAAPDEKPVIILDPGHGGADGGTTAGIRYEKTYNLMIAQYLKALLEEHGGFEVYLTRESDDTDIKFLPRALYIVEHNADLLLSLHCNSSTISSASGVLAIASVIEPYSAFSLGESILAGISEKTGLRNRGMETRYDTGDSLGVYYWNNEKKWDMPGASYLGTVSDYFSMNTWSSKFGTPSLIIEHGYLSNAGDRALVDKDETLKQFAEAEAEALIDYYYGHTHTFTAEKVTDFPSNCSLTGTKSYHCTTCGLKSETEALPAAPAACYYRQSASARATCEKDGFIEYICQISYNLNDKGYPTTVHSYTETLPKKGHAYRVTEDVPAGHGVDGRYVEYCDTCGHTVENTTPGDPHVYTKSSEISPTCTGDGSIVYSCSVCGDRYSEAIPALGHSLGEAGICTTCGYDPNPPETETSAETSAETEIESQGMETEAETRRPVSVDRETEPSCAHVFTEQSRTAPSCEEDGLAAEACVLCGEERTVPILALGHDIVVSMDTPAGCEKDGYYRARCLRCQKDFVDKHPATGHEYVTQGEDGGVITRECTRCGAVIEEEISRTPFYKSPLFLVLGGVAVIVAGQFVFLAVGHGRHRANKSAETGHTETDDLGDDEEEEAVSAETTLPRLHESHPTAPEGEDFVPSSPPDEPADPAD